MRLLVVLLSLIFAVAAGAAELTAVQRAKLARTFGVKPESIKTTPVDGLFEISDGGDVAYVTADGRYLLQGNLIDVKNRVNLTERQRAVQRKQALKTLSNRDVISYGAAQAPREITVFTDIDCGFCRRLHAALPDLEKAGIRVRYLFYPRAGIGSASWHKAESVWCADDRKASLDKAFKGQPLAKADCKANAKILHDYRLGNRLGVTGTPTIILDSGRVFHGLPPISQLIHIVKKGA